MYVIDFITFYLDMVLATAKSGQSSQIKLSKSVEKVRGYYMGLLRQVNCERLFQEQRLRGRSHPLQGWQCELSPLEDEAPLELPPGALLVKTFAFHHEIRHQA